MNFFPNTVRFDKSRVVTLFSCFCCCFHYTWWCMLTILYTVYTTSTCLGTSLPDCLICLASSQVNSLLLLLLLTLSKRHILHTQDDKIDDLNKYKFGKYHTYFTLEYYMFRFEKRIICKISHNFH